MSQGRIQLEILDGQKVVETRAFAGTVIDIGKLSKADLQLTDENVSRRHARIEIDAEGKVTLSDLQSTNGTKLNGIRVSKTQLADGDELEIGITRLRVRFDAELRKVAAPAKASVAGTVGGSSRSALSRDSFYNTQDDVRRGSRLALEVSLLWDEAPVQSEAFERQSVPPRFKGIMLLALAFTPLEFAGLAILASVLGHGMIAAIAWSVAIGFVAYFATDLEAWRHLLERSSRLLKRGENVYMGETVHSTFFVPQDASGTEEHPLIVPHRDGWALNLGLDGVSGDVLVDNKVVTVDDAKKGGALQDGLLPLKAGAKARLRFGKFSMLMSYGNVPPQPKGAFVTATGMQEFAYFALSLIVHFSILILFVYMQPDEEIQIRRAKNQMAARLVAVESIKNKEKKKEEKEEKEEKLPEKVDLKEDEVVLEDAAPSPTVTETERLEEVEEKKPNLDAKRPNQGPKVPLTEDQKKERQQEVSKIAKATAEKFIPTTMLASVTGKDLMAGPKNAGLNLKVIGGGVGAVGEAGSGAGAMGEHAGSGDTGGYAGMDFGGMGGVNGTDGSGANGGGLVAGLDKGGDGGGLKADRLKAAAISDKEVKAIVASGTVEATGGLSKKIIQQYMDRQKGQIILCYKKEVQKNPGLEGKVVVAFTIAPTGKVMAPSIRTSTLGNSTVEQCIVSRLGLFRFPQPENAGAVKVTYPFLFRTR